MTELKKLKWACAARLEFLLNSKAASAFILSRLELNQCLNWIPHIASLSLSLVFSLLLLAAEHVLFRKTFPGVRLNLKDLAQALCCTSVQIGFYLENTAKEMDFVLHLLAVELSLIMWKASCWFWVFWYPEASKLGEQCTVRAGEVQERVFKDVTRLKEFRWWKLGEDKSICSAIMLHSTITLAFLNGFLGIQQ